MNVSKWTMPPKATRATSKDSGTIKIWWLSRGEGVEALAAQLGRVTIQVRTFMRFSSDVTTSTQRVLRVRGGCTTHANAITPCVPAPQERASGALQPYGACPMDVLSAFAARVWRHPCTRTGVLSKFGDLMWAAPARRPCERALYVLCVRPAAVRPTTSRVSANTTRAGFGLTSSIAKPTHG